MLCIKNGRIHDAVHREPYTADILIENGKLLQIGAGLHSSARKTIRQPQMRAVRLVHKKWNSPRVSRIGYLLYIRNNSLICR